MHAGLATDDPHEGSVTPRELAWIYTSRRPTWRHARQACCVVAGYLAECAWAVLNRGRRLAGAFGAGPWNAPTPAVPVWPKSGRDAPAHDPGLALLWHTGLAPRLRQRQVRITLV